GLTRYELAQAGVPALFIAPNQSHAEMHGPFDAFGTGEFVGVAGAVTPVYLASRLAELIEDRPRRAAMSANGARAVDGRGTRRVAAEILRLLAAEHGLPAHGE